MSVSVATNIAADTSSAEFRSIDAFKMAMGTKLKATICLRDPLLAVLAPDDPDDIAYALPRLQAESPVTHTAISIQSHAHLHFGETTGRALQDALEILQVEFQDPPITELANRANEPSSIVSLLTKWGHLVECLLISSHLEFAKFDNLPGRGGNRISRGTPQWDGTGLMTMMTFGIAIGRRPFDPSSPPENAEWLELYPRLKFNVEGDRSSGLTYFVPQEWNGSNIIQPLCIEAESIYVDRLGGTRNIPDTTQTRVIEANLHAQAFVEAATSLTPEGLVLSKIESDGIRRVGLHI